MIFAQRHESNFSEHPVQHIIAMPHELIFTVKKACAMSLRYELVL